MSENKIIFDRWSNEIAMQEYCGIPKSTIAEAFANLNNLSME